MSTRRLIDQEQQQIQEVRHLINKKKAVVKLAEQKIQKMKEQMMATQTVFKANLQQISMLNHKVSMLIVLQYLTIWDLLLYSGADFGLGQLWKKERVQWPEQIFQGIDPGGDLDSVTHASHNRYTLLCQL